MLPLTLPKHAPLDPSASLLPELPLWVVRLFMSILVLPQGLQLSQANKDEISNLVLSSIKKHLQRGQECPQVEQHSGKTRVKRVNKHSRRRRKLARSVDRSRDQKTVNNVIELSEVRARDSSNQTSRGSSNLAPGGTWRHGDTTVIRQRVEQQAPQIEVSLDGLWLPTLSSFSPHDAGGAEKHYQPADSHWAERSSASVMVKFPEADTPPGIDEDRSRPATVASQALSRGKPKPVSKAGERCRAVTAGGLRRKAEVKGGRPIETGTSHLPRGLDNAEHRDRRGYKRSLGEPAMPCRDRDEESNEGGEATAISQHTATMLERSRALVARAKVREFCR